MLLKKPGNIIEPFSVSCKSLEVIQNPTGVVSQARINPGIRCLPLKQRRHLELFCGYVSGPVAQKSTASGCASVIPQAAAKPLGVCSEIGTCTQFHNCTPQNTSIKCITGYTLAQRAASRESTLSWWGKALVWKGNNERKKQWENKLFGMATISLVFSLILQHYNATTES